MIYIFGDCELDMQRYVLRCAGRVIHVRRKAFQVLGYLLRHRDRVITKQELAEQVWQDDFVSDAALESAIKAVRQAIGDSGRGQRYIQTVYGVGYRFIAAAEERLEAQAGSAGETSPALSNTPPTSADNAHIIPPSPLLDEGVEESDGDRKVDVRDEPLWPPEAHSPTAEWKVVTVLCCAPADATPESAPQEPETRYRHIQALYALTQPVVQGYEGNLQPVVGERILAVFGAPAAQEDHAQRAVRAALDLQRRLREANVDSMAHGVGGLAVRIGLHTGVVAVGGLGDSPTTAGAIVGDAVAGVIALQDRAAPGAIVCSAATAHLVRGVVQLAAADPVLVPGQSTPMSAYTVLGPRGRLRLMSPGGSRVRTTFVGRRRELKTLRALLARAEAGHGQVIGLVGEPGIGKSRLVYEFQRSLRDRPVTYLAASCVSHGAATPYLPILALLRRNCGLKAGDSPPAIATKVHASLEEVGLAPEPWAPYLLQLLGVTVGMEGFTALSHEVVKARTVEALVQLALHGARPRPLVLEIENLHWIDPSSQEVVAALVERLVGARVLLLLTYRPGYRPHWIAKSYATQIALSRLRVQDSRRVVQAILRKEPVPEPVVQDILARAEGNPLFLEELACTVKERGAFQRTLVVPTTLQAVLAARIDRLPAEAKHVLQVAAVIGREVAVPLLKAVAGLPSAALRQILAHLQAAELLYEQPHVVPPTLTFKHTLIQDAVYQLLLKSTRQRYHQQVAQALAERFPETAEVQPELLAQHYTEAGLGAQAIPYWLRAGRRALERSACREAVVHLAAGLEVLKTLPDSPERAHQELHLLTALGPACIATKGYADAQVERAYTRARELCQQGGDTPQLFPVLWGLWACYFVRGTLQADLECGEQLLDTAQRAQDSALLLEAHLALGAILLRLGEIPRARAHSEQGISLYRPQQHRSHAFVYGQDPGVACLSDASQALWLLGYPDQALQRNREAMALAQGLRHPFSLAFALTFTAWLHHYRRDVQATQEWAEAASTLSTEQGFANWWGLGAIFQGWVMLQHGTGREGMALMRQGLAAWQATGAGLYRPYFLALLAEAAGQMGQPEEGLTIMAEAQRIVQDTGERFLEAELYRLRGQLLLARAGEDQAETEASFRDAVNIARRQRAKSLELRSAISLSRLWLSQGRCAKARQLLAGVYAWFTEGFDTADLQEAKILLNELAENRTCTSASRLKVG